MQFKLMVATLVLLGAPAVFACGADDATTDAQSATIQKLMATIESKFGVMSTKEQFRCGGSGIMIIAKLGTKKVIIGDISADDTWKMISTLQKIAALDVSTVEKMKESAIALRTDRSLLEQTLAITAYKPNALPEKDRQSDQGELWYATMPICTETGGNSGESVGHFVAPVADLGVLVNYPKTQIYRKGDLIKSLLKDAPTVAKSIEIATTDQKMDEMVKAGSTDSLDYIMCQKVEEDTDGNLAHAADGGLVRGFRNWNNIVAILKGKTKP